MDWKGWESISNRRGFIYWQQPGRCTDRTGVKVRVVDDLTSGRLENIQEHIDARRVEFTKAALREPGVAREAARGINIVFHLAAAHGGRAYVDLHLGITWRLVESLFRRGYFLGSEKGRGRKNSLRFFRMCLSQSSAGGPRTGALSDRGSG